MLKLLKKKTDPKVGPDYMVLNLGPHHPGAPRNLRSVVQLDGDRVITCVPQPGFLHGGFEKQAETMSLASLLELVDTTGYGAAPSFQIAMFEALERLFGAPPSERAAFIRVLIAELDRIAEHLRAAAAVARDLGADLVESILAGPASTIDGIIAQFRPHGGHCFATIGGLRCDIPNGLSTDCDLVFKTIDRAIADTHRMLTRSRVFAHRTKNVGKFTPEEARLHGLTGPALRACGVAEDVRRDDPYLVYGSIQFDIAVGSAGDAYDRHLVRIEEIRVSMGIVREVLNMLPLGKVDGADLDLSDPLPAGEIYAPTECSRGELGCFVSATGSGDALHRLHLRTPSLYHYQAFGAQAAGHDLTDVLTFLASMDIRPEELDR